MIRLFHLFKINIVSAWIEGFGLFFLFGLRRGIIYIAVIVTCIRITLVGISLEAAIFGYLEQKASYKHPKKESYYKVTQNYNEEYFEHVLKPLRAA